MNWDDLNSEKSYNPQSCYNQSKLANVLFTKELAKRLQGTNVTVNSLHPGVIRTELSRHFTDTFGWYARLAMIIIVPISLWMFKSPKQGAQTTIYCAVSKDLNNVSGVYFSDCKPKEYLPNANDEDAKRLWDVSEKLCKLK